MNRRTRQSRQQRREHVGRSPFLLLWLLVFVSMLVAGFVVLQRPQPVAINEQDRANEEVQPSAQPTPTTQPDPTSEIVLQDTDYIPPAGALFVAPGGDDRNKGTQAAPWGTLAHAVDAAPDGATIVLRAGEYREGNITIAGKRLTLQPFPHEQVWLKGSAMVDTWQADGAAWRTDNWTPAPAYEPPPDSIDPDHPLAQHPDQVFVNGEPLQQVASKDAVAPGTFFVDYEQAQLFIGNDPMNNVVEASVAPQAIMLKDASGSVIRGLGFLHYATPPQRGALETDSGNVTFERNTAALNAGAGLSVSGADIVVRNNISVHNGQLGLHGNQADGLLMDGNRLAFNNQKHFDMQWEAGGAKIARSADTVWRNNLVVGNLGHGLWCDIGCYNATVVHNVLRGNERSGYSYEISARAIIASNVFADNAFGVNINESSEVQVYNNTLVENGINVRVVEGERTNDDRATRTRIPYNARALVVENNILAGGRADSSALVTVVDYSDTRPRQEAAAMLESLDNNAYYRRNSSVPVILATLAAVDGDIRVPNLDALREQGYEANGIAIDDVAAHPFFVDAANGDYRIQPSSPVHGVGKPLPPAVAAAIGVPPNVPVDLGALPIMEQTAARAP